MAQNQKRVDSLKVKLNEVQPQERFEVLNGLFKEYNTTNYQVAFDYAEQYYELAASNGDSVRIVQGGRMKAFSLMDLTRNEEALQILTSILGVAQRNQLKYPELRQHIKFILNNAGLASMYLGKYDLSLRFHFKSLIIREEDGDMKGLKNTYNNIGLVYFNLKDFQKAVENFLKAIEIGKKIDQVTELDRIYINLGLCYNELGKHDEAIQSFKKGFSFCGENCRESIIKEGLTGLGQAYYNNKEIEKAIDATNKSQEIARRQNDSRYISENLFLLGSIELDKGNITKALSYLEESRTLAEKFKLVETELVVYKAFSKLYNTQKDLSNSVIYLEKYIQLRDSVYNDRLLRDLVSVQTNYAERENLKTIAEKDQVLLLNKEIIERQRRQYIFIVVITCLVVALAAVLFYFGKRQQKVNRELSEAKNKIQEQNLQLSGYNKELEFKVAERTKDLHLTNESLKRVNRDLDNFIYKTSHDIRGPLATLKGMCNLAMVDVKDSLALDYLKKMDFTADRLNTILTRLTIVNYINNSVLTPSSISFSLLIDEILAMEKKKGIPERFKINYNIQPGLDLISDVDLVKLVLENLIDNAIKFYNNSERVDPYANILISKEDQFVKILVEDNGIGILNKSEDEVFQLFVRASERSETGGVGLYLAKLATEKIGGVISLDYSSEKGSAFKVLLPEDINLLIDQKSASASLLMQKVADLRMRKKNTPSISNS